jgi:hypothetical protein
MFTNKSFRRLNDFSLDKQQGIRRDILKLGLPIYDYLIINEMECKILIWQIKISRIFM